MTALYTKMKNALKPWISRATYGMAEQLTEKVGLVKILLPRRLKPAVFCQDLRHS
jgi:hypothetical protein